MYSASSCPFFPGQKSCLRFQLWLAGSRRARGSGTKHMFTSNKQFGIRGMPGDPIQHCATNLGRRSGSLHVASDSGSPHALLYLHCFWNVLSGCIHVQCECSTLLTWTLKKILHMDYKILWILVTEQVNAITCWLRLPPLHSHVSSITSSSWPLTVMPTPGFPSPRT